MNATNLGCQPEHQIHYQSDVLQRAALAYGQTKAALDLARKEGVSGRAINYLSANHLGAKLNLEKAAHEYFELIGE